MDTQTSSGGDFTEQSVAGQQDARVRECGDATKAVVGGKTGITLLEFKGLSDLVWRQVVSDHASTVELSPLRAGEVEDFGLAYGEWDDKAVWQIAEYGQ